MKKLFFILLGFVLLINVSAQFKDESGTGNKTSTNKSIYGEAGGGGIITSANFDSRFPGSANLGYRVGVGFFPRDRNFIVSLPFGLYYLIGNAPNYFEVEVTGNVAASKYNFQKEKAGFFFYPHIGYRLNKSSNAFFLKVEAGPLFVAGKVYPFPGLGLGYTFKN